MDRESIRRPIVAVVQHQSHSARPVRGTHAATVVTAGGQRSRGRRLGHPLRAEPGAFVLRDTAAATCVRPSPTAGATRLRLSATAAAGVTRIRLPATAPP